MSDNNIGAYVLIPILGLTVSFILFLDGKIGWGLGGLIFSFVILLPIALLLGFSRNKKDISEDEIVSYASPNIRPHYQNRSNTDPVKLISFKVELENRMRIFSDSNKIVDKTKDFEIFEKRMSDLLDHIEWSYKMYNEGMPVKINMSYEKAIDDYGRFYNENAVRIAKHIASSADTKQKAKNRIVKIEQIKASLKEAANKRVSISALDNILNNLILLKNKTAS